MVRTARVWRRGGALALAVVLLVAGAVGVPPAGADTGAPVSAETIGFDDFSNLAGLRLNGRAAAISQPVNANGHAALRVLDSLGTSHSSVFWDQPIELASSQGTDSFSQTFQFRINNNTNGGADGIVFVIAPSPDEVGGTGGGIGYEGLDHSIGVEFDTWNNGSGYNDPNGNHVGIDLNGDVKSIATGTPTDSLENGAVWTGWVDYDGATNALEVRASDDGTRPVAPLVSATVDIPAEVGGNVGYFGLTSASGAASQTIDVLSWHGNGYFPNVKPVADAGTDQTVSEGSQVSLDGSGSKPGLAGRPLTASWQMLAADGPPIELSSTHELSPSFTAFDDGTYRFQLTVNDGVDTASDEVTVRVVNAPPVVTSVAADPTATDGLAQVSVTVSDPGPFDAHTIDVDWGDGSRSDGLPVDVDGTGWGYALAGHRYAATGPETISVVAHDADGGVSAPKSTVVDVGGAGAGEAAPGASLWADSSTAPDAIWISGSQNAVTGLTHSNGDIRVSGSGHSFTGGTEYVGAIHVAGAPAIFDPAAQQVPSAPFPYQFNSADYTPGGSAAIAAGSAFHAVDASSCRGGKWRPSTPLVSGLYWVPCGVAISGSDVAGQVTIVATGDIKVSGAGADLSPFIDGLSFLTTSTSGSALDLSGSSQAFHGSVFAPGGAVKITGSHNTLDCGLLGQTVRISGSSNTVGGADCATNGGAGTAVPIAAPPLLVANLAARLTADAASVHPGDPVGYTTVVRNGDDTAGGGANLFVPTELGVANMGSSPVTVTGATYTLEVHDPVTDTWSLVASTDPAAPVAQRIATLSAHANLGTGVTYPTGADAISGTTVAPGALASWAGLAQVRLDTNTAAALQDPARVDAIRDTVTLATTGGTQVRRITRFSVDPLAELRATPGGTINNVHVHLTTAGSSPRTFDATSSPGLASIGPAQSVTVQASTSAPTPEAKGSAETDDAYVARLKALDGTALYAQTWATGVAAPGTLYAPQQIAKTTVAVPVLTAHLAAPGTINSGDSAAWTVTLTNTGSATATGVNTTLDVDGNPVTLTGVPGSIDPGQTVTATASSVTDPADVATLTGDLAVTWADATGPADEFGPVGNTTTVRVRPASALEVSKWVDNTPGNGVPADQIEYHLLVHNSGNDPLSGVTLTDPIDTASQIVPGTLTTTAGTITTGNVATDPTVGVTIGDLASGADVTVIFRVSIADAPAGTTQIVNQATVTSDQLDPIQSDDPTLPGVADPTITHVTVTGGGGAVGDGGAPLPGPTVGECDPAEGSTITAPTTITCTLTPQPGTSVDTWTITAKPVGAPADEARSIASGTGDTVSAVLDPTELDNGQWTITVTATGSDGGDTSDTTMLIVDGRLKLGRIHVSYNDMSVPVAGIPITITRSYDTLDRLHQGDFGQGWTLGVANFRAQTNRPLGSGGWTQTQCGSILGDPITCLHTSTVHKVTVTWPDGRTETFALTPKPSPPGFTFLNTVAYTGDPGTTSTLQPAPGDEFAMFAGTSDLYVPLTADTYDPHRFVLVAKDGTRYTIDRTTGLTTAVTADGHSITVTSGGITSSSGPSISFDRDTAGRITKLTGPTGDTRSYGYDTDGNLTGYTNGAGETQQYVYDDGHRLTAIPGGGSQPAQTLHFGPDGRVDAITDSAGRTTQVAFDLDGRTQMVTSPAGDLTTISHYTELGDMDTQTKIGDGKTAISSFVTDTQGRVLSSTDADGHHTATVYDAKGNPTSSTDAAGVTTQTSYNMLAEPVDTTVAGVVVTHRTYDTQGHLLTTGRPGQAPTVYTYAGGQPATVTSPTGTVTSLEYDQHGFLSVVSSPAGIVLRGNDAAGKVTSVTSPSGARTGFQYDPDGHLSALVGNNNFAQSWTYDAAGDVLTATDKLNHITHYTYDPSGNLASVKDRNGATTSYGYDGNGRVNKVTIPGAISTITTDAFGKPISVANPAATLSLAWTLGGQLTSETTHYTGTTIPDQTVTYAMGGTGKPSSISGAGSTTSYNYDSQGRLDTVADTVAGTFGYSYNPATGQLASMTRPNGVDDHLSFDADQRLVARDAINANGDTLNLADYTYDPAGLRDSMTDTTGSHGYSYDPDGRLTGVSNPTGSGQPDESFSYDPLGNRTSWNDNPVAQVRYNQADQLTQDATFTYGYDGEGNQTSQRNRATGATTTYTWNANHQLTKITNPDGTTSTYRYDPLGRRISSTDPTGTSYDVWAGANLRAALDPTGNITSRLVTTTTLNDTLAITTNGSTTYPIADGLGSTTATTDQAGTVTGRTSYSAYGTPNTTDPTSLTGYTGHQQDPGGLDYARARYYNPATGRFISNDIRPSDNRYIYAESNPVSNSDPSGFDVLIGYAEISDEDVKQACSVQSDVAVIGNLSDTEIAEQWAGHTTLNIPSGSTPAWSLVQNWLWIAAVIDAQLPVYLASNPWYPNTFDVVESRIRVFQREIDQLTRAGYEWDSTTCLRPPA